MDKQSYTNYCKSNKRDIIEDSFYDTVFQLIEKYILANNGTSQDAQDIFQDSLIIYINKLETGFELTCKLSSFLFAISRNLWLQRLARQRRYPHIKTNIACEQVPEYEAHLHHLEKEKVQELYELLLLKCRVNFGNDFMDVISSKDKETRKQRWQYKQKLAKIIKNYPEFQKLKKYVHWIK